MAAEKLEEHLSPSNDIIKRSVYDIIYSIDVAT